jgi:hypothetical protein
MGRGSHRARPEDAVLPIVTSFFTPAFMAEHFEYPGEIYCVICDTDVARAWASIQPRTSRIRYFAPNWRVVERLRLYGVAPSRVFTTGFPLPEENTGDQSLVILKSDLARRIVRLDPNGKYLDRYRAGRGRVGPLPQPSEPLTILFSIGGTGAQGDREDARRKPATGSLRGREGRACGQREASVRDYLAEAAANAESLGQAPAWKSFR